jgi:alpha-glucosidase (family GH31 glycosyl hydrolase)
MIEDGYYKHGIRIFWLDGSEPEYFEFPAWGKVAWKNAEWNGSNLGTTDHPSFGEVGQLFTVLWTQMFTDGLTKKNNESSSVMLPRAGYAGSWRTGAGL